MLLMFIRLFFFESPNGQTSVSCGDKFFSQNKTMADCQSPQKLPGDSL
jgi:hypothetical protein